MTQPVWILETERLELRRLLPDDLASLYALYRDPQIRRYFPEGVLGLSETQVELEWFLHGHPDHPELGLWATLLKETGAFIGRCGLLPWTLEGRQEVEVAFLLDRVLLGPGSGDRGGAGCRRLRVWDAGFDAAGLFDRRGQPGLAAGCRKDRDDARAGDGR